MKIQTFFDLGMKRVIPDLLDMTNGVQLNLGGGNNPIKGTHNLCLPDWDANIEQIPYNEESVAGIHCYHFLEHLEDPIRMLHEMQRVMKIGAIANIVVPYYSSLIAAQDLSHKKFFCEETWKTLFNNPHTAPYVRWEWQLAVHANFIMGIVERNICLFTQLVKR